MPEEKTTKEEVKVEDVKKETSDSKPAETSSKPVETRGPKPEFKKNRRRPSKRRERVRSEFEQKILNIRRVTRVSAGGRRFSFSVAMVVGNKKGKVGIGVGKAGDTALAIEKAVKSGQKNMVEIKRTKHDSIAHDIKAKYNSARIIAMPAKGNGLVAGSAVRDVLELAGITDVNAKIISGSKNKLNISRATIKALQTLKN